MDYVEALMAVAESLSDIRRRIIALETSVSSLDGNTTGLEELVERIDHLESREWNENWESEVDSLAEAAIENIDWEEKVRDALNCISFSVVVD